VQIQQQHIKMGVLNVQRCKEIHKVKDPNYIEEFSFLFRLDKYKIEFIIVK